MTFLQSCFLLVSVVPYCQALFGLDILVLSCFQAGDQKDGAEPGGTRGWQCPDQQCHRAGGRKHWLGGPWGGTRFSLRTLPTQSMP